MFGFSEYHKLNTKKKQIEQKKCQVNFQHIVHLERKLMFKWILVLVFWITIHKPDIVINLQINGGVVTPVTLLTSGSMACNQTDVPKPITKEQHITLELFHRV